MTVSIESYSESGSGLSRFEARGMGTVNILLLGGAPERVLREGAQEGFELLARLEGSLSKFLPSSDLSILNCLGAERPVRVGKDLLALVRRSRRAWELTGGAFDPTVAPLLDAWGLVDLSGRIPDAREVASIRSRVGMDRVRIDPEAGTVRLGEPGMSLDLGGIAKGYAVDLLGASLRARGIAAGAVISGRSSVVTWGAPPGEARWRFEVVHPDDPEEVLRTLQVEPGAVSSSGASERRFLRGGREYGHVLDPATGSPARGVRSATVWTETAILGDVLSTTLFVLGRPALEPDGAVRRLLDGWNEDGSPARASILLAADDTRRWGGFEVIERHEGAPGFRAA